METDNTDVTKLSYEELLAEYERSQWVLAFAMRYCGGVLRLDDSCTEEAKQYRVWYHRDEIQKCWIIELRERTNETH